MNRTLLLLLPALALAACQSGRDDEEEAAAFVMAREAAAAQAAATATAAPSAGVVGFVAAINARPVGRFSAGGNGEWTIQLIENGETSIMQEAERTNCCIRLVHPLGQGSPISADFQTMALTAQEGIYTITDVVRQ